MELVDGIKVTEREQLEAAGLEPGEVGTDTDGDPTFRANNRFAGRHMQDIEGRRWSLGASRGCHERGEQNA